MASDGMAPVVPAAPVTPEPTTTIDPDVYLAFLREQADADRALQEGLAYEQMMLQKDTK